MPTVSVIMGTYNCRDTLNDSIQSILAQTYTDWEFIICDDCSTDGTYELLKKYHEQYRERITILRNEKNQKLAFTLNRCLEAAQGEYIARMDGDDISVPNRLEKQLAYLKANPECDLVGTAMQRFSEKSLGAIDRKPEHPDRYSLRRMVPFHHATIMTYKRVYDSLGGYTVSERTIRGQDYDLWFRFFAAGFCGDNLEDALYMVREDEAAIRRRTVKVRWNTFKTTCYGFRLLHYPKWWIIRSAVEMVVKSLVPVKLVLVYRDWQTKKSR